MDPSLFDSASRLAATRKIPSGLLLVCLVLLLPVHLGAQSDLVAAELKIADGLAGFTQSGPVGTANSNLGEGVVSVGDLNGDGVSDLAVGQPEGGLSATGRIYILFLNSDGSVSSQVEISAGIGGMVGPLANGDQFGSSVAALGDVDGDGVVDLCVGAPGDDDGISSAGAVWILFLNSSGTVKAEQKISSLSGNLGVTLTFAEEFGTAVEGLGDLNGDGVPDLVVGSPRNDDGGIDRGALYVLFLSASGSVSSMQKISQTSGLFLGLLDDNGRFGSSLALLGDVTGNGFVELAIGQEKGLSNGNETGSVWIVSLFTNGLVLSTTVIEEGTAGFVGPTAAGDRFGCSVEALPDLNGDGVIELLVGAELTDAPTGGFDQGAVWILYLTTSLTVLAQDRIGMDEGGFEGTLGNFSFFGSGLTALGDLSGDGTMELVIGSSDDSETASRAGAIWVVSLDFCNATASASSRNAGTNPLSYTCTDPILGSTWTATIDLNTTGHAFAAVIGYTNAFQLPLPGGQTLLIIDATGSGDLLQLPFQAGPIAQISVAVPLDASFCGLTLSTQAVHFGGVQPFALSNAQDLVVGS